MSFRSELGFIRRVDVRQTEHFAEYTWRPERSRILSIAPSAAALVNWDRRGRVQDWITGAWLGLNSVYMRANTVNYDPAPGLKPFAAGSIDSTVGFTLRPTPRFRFGQNYLYSRLSARRDSTALINNHIVRSKINYQFSRPLSLRAIVDYNAVLPDTSRLDLERAKRFTADILFTYLVNPGTAFYIGYSEAAENQELAPFGLPSVRRIARPGSTGRQLFVKLSYLLRY